jgi:hypothetical protein
LALLERRERKMSNVRDMVGPGPCEAEICQRELKGGDRIIENEDDRVRVLDRNYHKGCHPTQEA